MSESLQFPGFPSAQRKSDYLTKSADIFQTMRGDETFIRVTKGPGGLLISLNWQEVVARVPKLIPTSLAQFKVSSLPAAVNVSGSMIVLPYVIAHPVNSSNGSAGSSNVSIAVCQPHSVNDYLMASPCPTLWNSGSKFNDSNGKTITMTEVITTENPVIDPNCSLTYNASGSTLWTFAYDIYDLANAKLLQGKVVVKYSPFANFNHSQASNGRAIPNTTGNGWILVVANEQLSNC